jgi:hypothetical protein
MYIRSHQRQIVSYERFPVELRLTVLQFFVEMSIKQGGMITAAMLKHRRKISKRRIDQSVRNSTYPRPDHLSAYAFVCREWQNFFELTSFQRMTLHQSDLPESAKVVQGERRIFVQWIWLHLELPEYKYRSFRKAKTSLEVSRHNETFSSALWNLVTILSIWETIKPSVM